MPDRTSPLEIADQEPVDDIVRLQYGQIVRQPQPCQSLDPLRVTIFTW
jgi:hypothetical protein